MTSSIEIIGSKSSSVMVRVAFVSLIVALMLLERLMFAISSYSTNESARMGMEKVPEDAPAGIVNVPEVAI